MLDRFLIPCIRRSISAITFRAAPLRADYFCQYTVLRNVSLAFPNVLASWSTGFPVYKPVAF